jgi:hypothetical protein
MRQYKKEAEKNDRSKDPNWVLMADTDEFLTFNYVHPDEEDETSYELIKGRTEGEVDAFRHKKIPLRKRLLPMEWRVTICRLAYS